ncbi:MAG TPA: hypothetical protein VJ254_13645 [Streptosporangiaceae bacterium]|nr:hypothetical protein [Streptosporangiaceae bacterium]
MRCAARGLRRAGRAEDRVAADEQGLGGGEHEGRDFRLPVTAALYRRWQPSISSGPAGSPPGPLRVARMTGSPGLVVMAYWGLKSGPGLIREMACRPLPGSRASP